MSQDGRGGWMRVGARAVPPDPARCWLRDVCDLRTAASTRAEGRTECQPRHLCSGGCRAVCLCRGVDDGKRESGLRSHSRLVMALRIGHICLSRWDDRRHLSRKPHRARASRCATPHISSGLVGSSRAGLRWARRSVGVCDCSVSSGLEPRFGCKFCSAHTRRGAFIYIISSTITVYSCTSSFI